MRVLIATVGSHGDVLPFVALAKEFKALGHEAYLYANPFFESYATDAGLRFVPISTIEEYLSLFGDPAGGGFVKASKRVARHLFDVCPQYYHAMKADVVPGETITLASSSSLLFAPRLLRETHAVPTANVYIAPLLFRSNCYPARFAPWWLTPTTPRFVKRVMWGVMDRFLYDSNFNVPLNRLRTDLGLTPVECIFRGWIHDADLVVGLFPNWFAEPQPDWPARVVLAGFPLYDHGAYVPLLANVKAFLDAGEPPVAFSAGTATATAHDFFATSIEACRRAGLRGILLTHFAQQVPASLPEGVVHFDYVPFGALLPRLAAFVHHGGIGSTSQAFRAGVPQLIRPVAYDQFDNSARAVKLGVARELLPRNYSSKSVARTLKQLISDNQVRERCHELAKRSTDHNAIARACNAILGCFREVTPNPSIQRRPSGVR